MFPDAGGTPIAFDGRRARSIYTDIVLDPAYVFENCRVVCFVQDDIGGEVWQAASLLLSELPPATATTTSSWSHLKARFGDSP